MRNNVILVAVLILISTAAQAQQNDFAYRRKLTPAVAEGWHTLVVPVSALAHAQPAYHDLRLYTYTTTDTTEVPYLLKVRTDLSTTKELQLRKLNESRKGNDLYVTFELPANETANYLDLTFDKPDFEATAALEGSTDQINWFAILSPQRIVSIKNDRVDFHATTLTFAETNYRYLRVTVKSTPRIELFNASFRKLENTPGIFRTIPNHLTTGHDKTRKTTAVTLTLDQKQPISKIALSVANDGDYYRPVTIEALADSARTEKGWIYHYTQVYTGFLTSIRANDIAFTPVTTNKLRLTIDNADNPPLTVQLAAAYGPQVEIIAKLKPNTEYYLLYGSKAAASPSYDLIHFEKQIPADRAVVEAGQEEYIGREHVTGTPLFENKAWLWAVMALVIGVLGYFTLRMMKSKT